MGEGGGTTSGIVGRDAELARLRAALAAARTGDPGAVVIDGAAGIGKTSLVTAALTDGQALLTASGDEAECDLDFGVVHHVLRSAGLDGGATGGRAQAGADPLRVGARLVGLVDEAALPPPLVVLVDDAQWADRPSMQALTFAARRLRVDGVLLCVVCRSDALDGLPPGLLRLADATGGRIELGPLAASAIAALAARTYGRPLPDGPVERLREHAAGNPLHTLALLDELDFEVVAGRGPLPAPRELCGAGDVPAGRVPGGGAGSGDVAVGARHAGAAGGRRPHGGGRRCARGRGGAGDPRADRRHRQRH